MEIVVPPTRPNPWSLTMPSRSSTDTKQMLTVHRVPEMTGLRVESKPTCLKYPDWKSVGGIARKISDNLW